VDTTGFSKMPNKAQQTEVLTYIAYSDGCGPTTVYPMKASTSDEPERGP
jgi:hypothetical protein